MVPFAHNLQVCTFQILLVNYFMFVKQEFCNKRSIEFSISSLVYIVGNPQLITMITLQVEHDQLWVTDDDLSKYVNFPSLVACHYIINHHTVIIYVLCNHKNNCRPHYDINVIVVMCL